MNTPSSVSQEELLAAIKRVGDVLSVRFSFGTYEPYDIRQQIALFALEALPRFDSKAGKLEGFIFRHCKNRLTNMKRNVLRRADPPCQKCYDSVEHERGPACDRFVSWKERQDRKAALAKGAPTDAFFHDGPDGSTDVEMDAATREMLRLLDEQLPVDLRRSYLQVRDGVPLSKPKKEAVLKAVRDILGDSVERDEP
jgi:hypothetical protein